MPELPSGTVTFLFTDIEGSTRLLHGLGQHRYDELLTAHQEILQAAITAHEGRVVDTQGDSFFVAFRTANDGVAAAVDAQRDLAAHAWPEEAEVKVRMGLHTGEPKVGEERYVGIGVHRAARIGAAGHGGQVLLSSTTKELAEEDLPPGVSIRDLGERRLKDIEQPQHLYQLVIEGLESDFGPLNTLDVALARKRRRMYAGAALIGVLAAAVAIPVFAFAQSGSSSGVTTQGNAVAVIDPSSNQVTDVIPVGARPGSIASGSGSIWVANLDDQSVSRIDLATGSVTRALSVLDTPTGLAASPGAVWVVGSNLTSPSVDVRRIDPRFNTVGQKIQIGNVSLGGLGSVAALGKSVWIAPSSGVLTRLNPRTGRPAQTHDPNAGLTSVAVGSDAVWFTDREANTVTRVDPTGLLTTIPVGHGPSAIAIGAGAVWVADSLDDRVVRIDPSTRAVTTTIPVGQDPVGIAVGPDAVWVANSGDGTVTRIDPQGGKKSETIPVGGSPQSIVAAGGRVWVTVAPKTIATTTSSRGGTVRMSSPSDVDYMDPALAFGGGPSWQLLDAICAKLLNYPDKPAPAGSQLEPEVAQSLPTRSPDGKSYTFRIRKGFRFSPPSNQAVTAQTFRYTIERSLSPVMKGPAQGYLGDVVGAKAYMSGKAAHISGIVVRGNTLTVHLLSPAPDLPSRLAMPFFCAVPLDTPRDPRGVRMIASAGPYYVTSYTPGQGVVLTHNPNYRGSRPHHVDRIALAVGVSAQKAEAEVVAGTTDYTGVDQDDAARIAARYGSASPAARNGKQQYFVNPQLSLDFIALNSHRPLFRDLRLRQAVNYAIDRRALARIGAAFNAAKRPTDQYLSPGVPGFKNAHIYPFTPNLAAARRLAGGQARTAVLYTCNTPVCDQLTQIVKTNLVAIGIQVVVKKFSKDALYGLLTKKGEPYDLALSPYFLADYPDPIDFFNNLPVPGSVIGYPIAADPSYQRQASAATELTGPPRYLAYGQLDVNTIRNSAPLVPIGNLISQDFFSKRIGCQVYQPIYGMDLAALCIKH